MRWEEVVLGAKTMWPPIRDWLNKVTTKFWQGPAKEEFTMDEKQAYTIHIFGRDGNHLGTEDFDNEMAARRRFVELKLERKITRGTPPDVQMVNKLVLSEFENGERRTLAACDCNTVAEWFPAGRPLITWGRILLGVGILVAGYFLLVYDTTGGRGVHNIGLQQNRQLGAIAGMILAAVGAIMLIVDYKFPDDDE